HDALRPEGGEDGPSPGVVQRLQSRRRDAVHPRLRRLERARRRARQVHGRGGVRHARPEALDVLEPLLAKIRKLAGLKEKKRELFYRKGRLMLHFHEDPAGLFADLCADGKDLRLRVSTQAEQRVLLAKLKQTLSG